MAEQPNTEMLKASQANTHAMNQQNRMRNYLTNEDLDMGIMNEDALLSWQNSNKGVADVYQLLQDNPNASDEDIYTTLGGNYYDAAYNYGGRKMGDAKWRDAFTIAPRAQVINDIRKAAANYGTYMTDQTAQEERAAMDAIAARNAAARAEVDARNQAGLQYKRGNIEVSIPRAFTDYLKGKAEELSVATDAEKAVILEDIRQQLVDMGAPISPKANGEANMTKLEDLITKGANAQSRLAIRDILTQAYSRQDEQYNDEVYQPKPVDVMKEFQDRMQRQYQLDRDKEQKRIERARTREGFAGLAATIGDMIRASEGAPVANRDWQRIYDNLTAQEKANINNYQVRMQKLQDDIRAEKARQDAIKVAAAQKAADQQFQFNLELQKEKAAAGKQAASDAAVMERTKQAGKDRIEAAKQRAKTGSDPLKGTVPITLKGENFYMRNTETFKQACRKINGMLANYNIPIDLTAQIGLASSRTDEAVNGVTNALEQLEIVTGTPNRAKKQVTQAEFDAIKSYLNSIKVSTDEAGGNKNDGWDGFDD